MSITNLIGDTKEFIDRVFDNLNRVGVDVSTYELDHIAYRAITTESYAMISKELSEFANKANSKVIRERAIDMYLLRDPLEYKGNKIKYLELMAPAVGDRFKEGLEHIEFFSKQINLHDLVRKYNQLVWNTNSIDRKIGAEVGLLFENGANAKFKNQSMAEIIDEEEKLRRLADIQSCGLEGPPMQ